MTTKKQRTCDIEIVNGVEGLAIYLNGCRIGGPKPWGGGTVIHKWVVDVDRIKGALPRQRCKS